MAKLASVDMGSYNFFSFAATKCKPYYLLRARIFILRQHYFFRYFSIYNEDFLFQNTSRT